jgi:MFS family permease
VLAPLYAAGFVTAFGAHAVAANLGVYGIAHHVSLWELGLLLGIYDLAEIALKPVFGTLSDRIGPKPVLLGGLVAFALASGGFVVAGHAQWLGAARLAQGAAAAAFSPAAGATLATLGGRKRTGQLFGGYGGAKSLGYLAGPLAGGALVTFGGYDLLFATLAVVAAGVAALAARTLPSIPPAPRARSTLLDLARQVSHSSFLRPVTLLALGTAALSAGVGYLPVLGARHHLTPLDTGALVSLLAATTALLQPWAGRAHDRAALPANAAPGALLLAAAGFMIAAIVPNSLGIAVAAIMIGAGVAISTPIGFADLAASAPTGRIGQTMGAGEVGRELGDAGGPILVGAFSSAGLATGLVALAATISLGALTTWQRSHPQRARTSTTAPPPHASKPPA